MENISEVTSLITDLKKELRKNIVGYEKIIDAVIISVISNGHLLLEGFPGLGKTLIIKSIAQVMDLGFSRIQFMPDLLPSDIVGTVIYNQQTSEFIPKKGPIFSNIILADEINRAPSKVQSALLQAMEERQITLGDHTYKLSDNFFVLATQNPIDQEGTYRLPEAQVDRFIMKILIDYPDRDNEFFILKHEKYYQSETINKILNDEKLTEIKKFLNFISIDDRIISYIIDITRATRSFDKKDSYSTFIEYGASPRASIALYKCSKARALIEGRDYVIPEDIKYIAPAVLRHRIGINYEAQSENLKTDDIIKMILQKIQVP